MVRTSQVINFYQNDTDTSQLGHLNNDVMYSYIIIIIVIIILCICLFLLFQNLCLKVH